MVPMLQFCQLYRVSMKNPYGALLAGKWPQLAGLAWEMLQRSRHGDLQRWLEAMEARPACQKGIAVPEPLVLPTDEEGVEKISSEISRKILQK